MPLAMAKKSGVSPTTSANHSPQSRSNNTNHNQHLLLNNRQLTNAQDNGESPLPTFASQSPGQKSIHSPNVRLVSRQIGGMDRVSITLTIPPKFQSLYVATEETSAYS